MGVVESLAVLAMVVYAIYKQTKASPAGGPGRFKMALIYGGVGIAATILGGWKSPEPLGWVFLLGGIVLSAVIGIARGLLTKVWIDADGNKLRQGTWLTIALFIALLIAKVGSGVYAAWVGIQAGASFGEVLVVVAVMIAVQAEIVHRRALALPHNDVAVPNPAREVAGPVEH